jgi:hypothetical protein
MFFRFGSALALVVLISLAGTALEKRNLKLRRAVSRQQYRLDVLLEQHAANRVLAQQLGAPSRLVDKIDEESTGPDEPLKPVKPDQSNVRKARHKSQPGRPRSG